MAVEAMGQAATEEAVVEVAMVVEAMGQAVMEEAVVEVAMAVEATEEAVAGGEVEAASEAVDEAGEEDEEDEEDEAEDVEAEEGSVTINAKSSTSKFLATSFVVNARTKWATTLHSRREQSMETRMVDLGRSKGCRATPSNAFSAPSQSTSTLCRSTRRIAHPRSEIKRTSEKSSRKYARRST